MKSSHALVLFFFLLSNVLFAQVPIPVGAGSYASFPPDSVIDEGEYFAKSYRTLRDGWPYYLHERMQDKPVATNEWFSNAIFEQYTGELWVYPQVVEADIQGVKASAVTGFKQSGTRAVDAQTDASVTISATVEVVEDGSTQIIADMEGGFPVTWLTTGDFVTNGPRTLQQHNHSGTPENYLGDYYFDSYFTGNQNKGSVSSPLFTLEYDYLHFLVAGGATEGAEVRLMHADTVVYTAQGSNSLSFEWVSWDLRDFKGKQVQIVVIDETIAGWGWVACDNFVLSNKAAVGSSFTTSFWPADAKAYDWSETSFTFALLDDLDRGMITSMTHGVPFTFIDILDVNPVLNTSASYSALYDSQGAAVTAFPYTGNALVIEVNGQLFGIHVASGTQFVKEGESFKIIFPESLSKPYVVVSNIPDLSLIASYDALSRNKITESRFDWDVEMTQGQLSTSFVVETENYDSGLKGGNTLMAFIPHQWRNTTTNFSYIPQANYINILGDMKTGQGTTFTFSYDYGGMPPFMPEPLNMDEAQKERMNALISERAAVSKGFNGNTYAKGLGEESNMMLMARELGHSDYETLKTNLKNELIDWFTFTPEEASQKSYYFAEYPNYGALIGFPPGYGSQGFNDLHFHNGYFIIGAARLMMVDEDFKAQYGEMVKLVARSYASWLRYGEKDDVFLPFMRNFDPYYGHSFAGGTGDGGGNNQESTSESLNAWFGIYALGVALDDEEIMEMGATGFTLEGLAADQYWMNRYDDIPEEYPCEYVGILRTGDLAMATYFSGDPAWAFGIQFVPSDHYYNYVYYADSSHYQSILESMIQDRISFDDGYFDSNNIYENIVDLGAYLGGYVLNYMQIYAPKTVSDILEKLYVEEGGEWTTHVNVATNYYVSNTNLVYGKPAEGYYTSSITSTVFENADGELTYVLYNPSDEAEDIVIYNGGAAVDTITVGAEAMYNSQDKTPEPTVSFAGLIDGDILIQNTPEMLQLTVSDKDNNVASVDLYMNGTKVTTLTEKPYQYLFSTAILGNVELVALATDDDQQSAMDTVLVEVIANNQMPYNGTPFAVPSSVIPAVEWDLGGSIIAYWDDDKVHEGGTFRNDEYVDTEGGEGLNGNIGWVRDGEWLEYTIDVAQSANYDIIMNYSSAYGGAKFYYGIEGLQLSDHQLPVATTSWADFQNDTAKRVALEAGEQVLRVSFIKGGVNLKSISFEVNTDPVSGLDNDQASTVIVSPNPVTDKLSVCLGGNDYQHLTLLSLNGVVVLRKDLSAYHTHDSFSVDMSSLYSGLYLLVLSGADGQEALRISKE